MGPRRQLERSRVSSAYRHRLKEGYRSLQQWAANCHRQGPAECACSAELEVQLLCDYGEFLFSQGVSTMLSLFRHSVLAVQTEHRHLKGHLRGAWDVVKSWEDKVL